MSRSSRLPEVRLRKLASADLPQLLAWRNSPSIYKWCRQFEPISADRHAAWFASIQDEQSTRMYGIQDAEGILVGVCGLTSIDYVNSRAEFSLYVGPEHHGAGFGEAGLRALCAHGFNVLNLNSIWGEAFDSNPAMKIFKRVGFKEEGRRRQFYFRQGRYIDAILFSLLRSEYGSVKLRVTPFDPKHGPASLDDSAA